MAQFLVINTSDSGSGSLRQALLDAEANGTGADTITFAPWLLGSSIFLQSGLEINSGSVTVDGDIDGDGDTDIIISGDQDQSTTRNPGDVGILIDVKSGATATLQSLRFDGAYGLGTDGFSTSSYYRAEDGVAGLRNAGTLNLVESSITNALARGGLGLANIGFSYAGAERGGAGVAGIFNSGTLTVTDSLIYQCQAVGGKGGSNNQSNFPGGDGGGSYAGILSISGAVVMDGFLVQDSKTYGGDGGDSTGGIAGNGGKAYGVYARAGSITGQFSYSSFAIVGGYHGTGATGFPQSGDRGGFGANYAVTQAPPVVVGGIFGTTAGESLNTTGAGQLVFGLAGDDRITDGFGAAELRGGGGNDYIQTTKSGHAYGGTGNDRIVNTLVFDGAVHDGGRGIDLIDHSQDLNVAIVLDMSTGAGVYNGVGHFIDRNFENFIGVDQLGFVDTVRGTDGDNIIMGLGGNDILSGRSGNDTLIGGADNDTLRGGNYNDLLEGDSGNDFLFGDNGNDNLFGGANNDQIHFGRGDDTATGGSGNDLFFFARREGLKNVVTDATDGEDKFNLAAFKYANKNVALSHFSDAGGANNNKIVFVDHGTKVTIFGMDLSELNRADIVI
ncbi:MAG: hypothetical protein H6873_08495 [Hyphomicrobiaceae bacterium]|nr:hypothetical protein [Hyphomicrobiaceae bacterium]